MTSVVEPSGNQDTDGILWGWKWDFTDISYSFPTSTAEYNNYAGITNFQAFNTAQENAIRSILGNVSSFTNLTFTETTQVGAILRYAEADSIDYTDDHHVAGHTGDHAIGSAESNPPELSYNGNPPNSPLYAQGDAWFNTGTQNNYNNPTSGGFAYAAGLMHETGHNLGLKHGHSAQDGHGTTFPALPSDHDSYEYSVMTYRQYVGDPLTRYTGADHPTTFMQDDIAALQYMYGANYGVTAHNTNTTYSWSATTGQEFIDSVGQTDANGEVGPSSGVIFMTVWDGGGVDTYDFSNYTTNLSVDLTPGNWTLLDTSTARRQLANLDQTGPNGPHYARGNIANAQVDPNNSNETASLIDNATGGSGDDSIYGNDIANVLSGGAGNDTLRGGLGDDTLLGGNDNDTLKGGGGADHLDGGAGIDTADYAFSSAVTVDLLSGTGSGGYAAGDTLVNVENVSGTAYADSLSGDDGANELRGGDGNDYLNGRGGADSLLGGNGDDTLKGGGGADNLDGGAGNDSALYIDSSAGVIVSLVTGKGSGGSATGDTLAGIENLSGSLYDDTLTGDANANTLDGLNGNDTLKGGGGADSLDGGNDNDTLKGGGGADRLVGGLGIDTALYAGSAAGVTVNLNLGTGTGGDAQGDVLTGIENLTGSSYADTLIGDSGANVLDGGAGADTLYGLGGNDTFLVDASADLVYEATGAGTDTVVTMVSYALLAGQEIEFLTAADPAATAGLQLVGNALSQRITGSAGADVIDDGGTGGADRLVGLGGNDRYVVNNSADQVIEAAGGGTDQVETSVSYTLGANQAIEALSAANPSGTAAISLIGNALAQLIVGNDGLNTLSDGGVGASDTLSGLGGNDRYVVNNAGDKVIEDAGGGTDRVYASVSYALTAKQEIEALTTTNASGTAALHLTGNAHGQTIVGNAGADTISDGGAGAPDMLYGLGGDDRYVVNNAGDHVVEGTGGGFDVVYAAVGYTLTAGQEIESLGTSNANGTAGIDLTGNDLAQAIVGNAGANVVDGRGGNDMLRGGGGGDTFRFDTALNAATNVDRVSDFAVGADMIELSHAIFTSIATAPLSADAFYAGTAAHDASDRIVYNAANGALFYDGDGSGAGAATQFATLSRGLGNLGASSFQVV